MNERLTEDGLRKIALEPLPPLGPLSEAELRALCEQAALQRDDWAQHHLMRVPGAGMPIYQLLAAKIAAVDRELAARQEAIDRRRGEQNFALDKKTFWVAVVAMAFALVGVIQNCHGIAASPASAQPAIETGPPVAP